MAAEDLSLNRQPSAILDVARLELAKLHTQKDTPLRQTWLQLAALAAQALQVERIGLWTLIDDGRAIRCRYLFQRSSRDLYQGAVLRRQDFPSYFAAMGGCRTIMAHDAVGSAMTRELRATYLEPLGITSLLDAPIYAEGRIVGIVCHEHIGPQRIWTETEAAFAGAVADAIARLYLEHQRQHAQSALEAYQQHVLELNRMEAIGRVAANIAHDFRGILGAAHGFAELLQRMPDLPPQARAHTERIIEALERGQRLTRQMVSFGNDEPMSPRVLDPAAAIEQFARLLHALIGKAIRLTLNADRCTSRIFIDEGQLERAVLNLVLNARDAMPQGGEIVIDVRDSMCIEDGEEASYVLITVRDTGSGMDPETCARALRPFFSTKGEGGTGLGLAIVDQIVTRCGGRMEISSELGVGTTVSMYLPRIAPADVR
jgi:two-component system cell cycle sensor histidine kinase/response regulator CckA